MSKNDVEPPWGTYALVSCSIVLIVMAIIAFLQYFVVSKYFLMTTDDKSRDLTPLGLSGDFFGFINALASAFAFALFIITLLMQRHELKLQRRELDETQLIMDSQKEEMRKQNLDIAFFAALELLRDLSRRTSEVALGRFTGYFGVDRIIDDNIIQGVNQRFRHDGHGVMQFHWALESVLKLIESDPQRASELYIPILKSIFEIEMLDVLMAYGITPSGAGLKPLIEKYGLVEEANIRPQFRHLYSLYAVGAFASDIHPNEYLYDKVASESK